MIFKKQILFLILLFPFLLFADATDLKTDSERVQVLCTAFWEGDLDTLSLYSSLKMKQGIKDGTLALAILQLSTLYGRMCSLEGAPERTAAVDGVTIFIQAVKLERQDVNCIISIDSDGKLCGFYVRPQVKKQKIETNSPPEKREIKSATAGRFTELEIKIGEEPSLPGTLTLPEGKRPYPAIILIHGSGPNDRDETVYANKPFRDLAELLVERGIAVLRYDKRTLVYPEECQNKTSFTIDDETVNDALAAVGFLRNTPEIAPDGIWLLGHSLGGMMLPRIASKTAVPAGYIFMAAPAVSLPELLEEQGIYLLKQDNSLAEAEKEEALAALKKQTELLSNPDGTSLPDAMSAYWKDLSRYNQIVQAKQIAVPMLFLQGKRDFQVHQRHLELWKTALSGRPDCQFILYDELNHLLQPGTGTPGLAEYATPSRVPEKVADDIAAFIRQHTVAH